MMIEAAMALLEGAHDAESFQLGMLAGLLLGQTRDRSLDGLNLTERQAELAQLVAQGMSNNEIGAQLGIAPATVKKHLEQVYQRVGVANRTQLAALVLRSS